MTSQALVIAALSQFLIATILLARHWKIGKEVKLLTIFFLCVCGYALKQTHTDEMQFGLIWWGTFVLSNSLVGLIWLFAISVMGEKRKLKPLHYIVAVTTLLLPISGELIHNLTGMDIRNQVGWTLIYKYFALLLELSLMSHAVWLTYRHWQADMVDLRRYWRMGVITICFTYIALVIIAVQLIGLDTQLVKTIEFSLLFFISLLFNVVSFSVNDLSVFTGHKPEKRLSTLKSLKDENNDDTQFNPKHIEAVLNAMLETKLYRKESLTITELANQLTLQEYKIRRIINNKLGYRNFNDFLNFYRIQEAKQMLSSDEYIGVPILTIAMKCGFKAISSFNRAFKELEGITPTAFRKGID